MSSKAWRSYEYSDFDPYHDYPLGSPSSSSRRSGLAAYIPHVDHETAKMLPSSSSSLVDLSSTVTSKQTFASDTPLLSASESGYGQPATMRLVPHQSAHVSEKDASASSSEASSDSMYAAKSSASTSSSAPDAGPSNPRRSTSATSFVSSPLNPTPTPPLISPFARPRLPSTHSSVRVTRIASEESRALSGYFPSSPLLNGVGVGSQRGSMILYRLADLHDDNLPLSPPVLPGSNRASIHSVSGDSILSLSSDSKYPSGMMTHTERGVVAYPYDPTMDVTLPGDEEDLLHDPKAEMSKDGSRFPWRGVGNVGALIILVAILLCLFIVFPAVQVFNGNDAMTAIVGNTRINSTGQASEISEVLSGRTVSHPI